MFHFNVGWKDKFTLTVLVQQSSLRSKKAIWQASYDKLQNSTDQTPRSGNYVTKYDARDLPPVYLYFL
jgi:hypothetical protein